MACRDGGGVGAGEAAPDGGAGGKRGRGAAAEIIVFGLLKRDGKVYTEIVPNVTKSPLRAVVCGHADPESVILADGWLGYDGLVDLGYARHHRVHHGNHESALGPNHINGIESFWGYVKHRLMQTSRRQPKHYSSPSERNRISLQPQECGPLQRPAIHAQKVPP